MTVATRTRPAIVIDFGAGTGTTREHIVGLGRVVRSHPGRAEVRVRTPTGSTYALPHGVHVGRKFLAELRDVAPAEWSWEVEHVRGGAPPPRKVST